MTKLGMSERLKVAAVRARRARRATAARLLGSSLLRWRYGRLATRTLAIAPRDIRPCDRMFWPEVEAGFMGLAGSVAQIGGGSPFDCDPPSAEWERELHGFAWLRHIDAAQDDAAEAWARQTVLDWIGRDFARGPLASRPDIRARRIVSWLSASSFIMGPAESAEFEVLMRGLAADITALSANWRMAGEGRERLAALTALTLARVAFEEEDEHLASVLSMLAAEIDRQVLPDGGHVSRNPAALIEVLLDWLPLKSCFEARGMTIPQTLLSAIERAVGMVRFLRLGDGGIARFNGMGAADASVIATLLSYDEKPVPSETLAPVSRYARLQRGGTIVIADVGAPPSIEFAEEACAGCLALEASVGRELLFVNMGTPGAADGDWRALSRATASHTSATLGETSSGTSRRGPASAQVAASMSVALAGQVTAIAEQSANCIRIEASHEGYVGRFGLVHRRIVCVDDDGKISGTDRFEPKRKSAGSDDVPFAVHFHLHPSVSVEPSSEGMTGRAACIMLRLSDGTSCRFEISGAATSIEESTFLATNSGPVPTLRIVARGIATGAASLEWSVRRAADRGVADASFD